VGFFAERNTDEGSRRKTCNQDITVCYHFFCAAGCEHHRFRFMPVDFPSSTLCIFVRVKLEDELSAAGDLDCFPEKSLTVLTLEYLPQRRCADQHVVPVGKVVAAISLAVIEIGYSRNDDSLGACAFTDEEIAISLACDAESMVCIAQARSRCTSQPARKESETLDEAKQDSFSVRNPLLNQHYLMVSNVLLHIHVRTGNYKVIRPILTLIVDGKVMILQILPASTRQLVTYDSELHQPASSKNLVKAVAVVG